MAGEKVLLIDPSAAVQDIAQTALEEAGYRVSTGSNGIAALTAPELNELDALVLGTDVEGVEGFLATRELKTSPDTYQVPILLLIPEDQAAERGSQTLHGANGFLVKPFSPTGLVTRVEALIEERGVREKAQQYLKDSADTFMQDLAEKQIRDAVENKTQIIVERAIQNVISELDQRIGEEVNQRMSSLTSEREQELVRATVHEVAQSMVEKLAERKVSEVIETLLAEKTDEAIRKSAESAIPNIARKQLKDSLEHTLPREINQRVQKSMEDLVPDVSKKIVMTIDGIAQKVVPKAARENLPDLTEKHVKISIEKALPQMVRDLVAKELVRQINDHVEPAIRDAATRINRRTSVYLIVALLVMLVALIVNALWTYMLVN
jgi:DNA-binding response OmpR family regulator